MQTLHPSFSAPIRGEPGCKLCILFFLHLTPRTSHLTPHSSHLTPHTSHLTPHPSHLTPHTSHRPPRTSHLTHSYSSRRPPAPTRLPVTLTSPSPPLSPSLATSKQTACSVHVLHAPVCESEVSFAINVTCFKPFTENVAAFSCVRRADRAWEHWHQRLSHTTATGRACSGDSATSSCAAVKKTELRFATPQ